MNLKKYGKRALTTLLSAGLLLACAPAALAASPSDLEGHWAQAEMEVFIEKGLMNGYGDGVYKPDDGMTRAQFAALINRTSGLAEEADLSDYADVQESDWYYADMSKAVASAYMAGTSATTLSPNTTVTREQAVTMLARLLGLEATEEGLAQLASYTDADRIDDWAVDAFAAMVEAGYVKGTSDTTLSPTDDLTRAQGVKLLHQMLDKLADLTENGGKDEAAEYVEYDITGNDLSAADTTFDGDIVITGEGGSITFVNCVFNGNVINKGGEGARVIIAEDCKFTEDSGCVIESSVIEATLETDLPKFLIFCEVPSVSCKNSGAVLALSEYEVEFNGKKYSIENAEYFSDDTTDEIVPYSGQEANFHNVAKWTENGEEINYHIAIFSE